MHVVRTFIATTFNVLRSAIQIGRCCSIALCRWPCSNTTAFSLETPLQLAVSAAHFSGHFEVLRFLIAAGANISVTDDRCAISSFSIRSAFRRPCTRYKRCSCHSQPIYALACCINRGKCSNSTAATGRQSRRRGAERSVCCIFHVVQWLYPPHISLRHRLNSRQTPLHLTACHGSVAVTRCLLKAGADVNAKTCRYTSRCRWLHRN